MKKYLCIICTIFLSLSLCACNSTPSTTPQEVVSSMLENYKAQNFDVLNDFFDGKVSFSKDLTLNGYLEEADIGLMQMFLDKLCDIDFEILNENISEDGKTAVVEVNIKANNVGEYLTTGIKEALPLALKLAMDGTSQEELMSQVINVLLSPVQNAQKVKETTFQIELIRKGNSWKIGNENTELFNSITGGFIDIVDELTFLK